jgi:hypothetical protein
VNSPIPVTAKAKMTVKMKVAHLLYEPLFLLLLFGQTGTPIMEKMYLTGIPGLKTENVCSKKYTDFSLICQWSFTNKL